jgi:N-acetyl sugar amidotransferase
MAQCRNCLYNIDHPFGLTFNVGLCSGCITHQEKYSINWDEKRKELLDIVKWAKSKSKSYDCLVPVIGDAEDYYVVSKVLESGMNPLVVSVNSYFLNDIGWTNLQNLITSFDLDSWIYNPEIQTYKELIRTSLRKYNHMYLPWLQLHTSFPIHVAKQKKIPLIVWGGNQAVEQVGKFSHYDNVEMSSWYRIEHDLFGNDIQALMGNGAQVNERKVNYYRYPDIHTLGKNLRGIYLSNYMFWDPLKQNFSMLKYGFKPQRNLYSFDPFERAGSSIYYKVHDILKSERNGYRKIIDQLTREIRHGRLNKNEAELLREHYEYNQVDIKPFFDWLGVTDSGRLWFEKHKLSRSKHHISRSPKFNEDYISLPKKLNELVPQSFASKKEFILYGKELNID